MCGWYWPPDSTLAAGWWAVPSPPDVQGFPGEATCCKAHHHGIHDILASERTESRIGWQQQAAGDLGQRGALPQRRRVLCAIAHEALLEGRRLACLQPEELHLPCMDTLSFVNPALRTR